MNTKPTNTNYDLYEGFAWAFPAIMLLLIMLFSPCVATAQTSSYASSDNLESAVLQVESMRPNEIKAYNSWKEKGIPEQARLLAINAIRAQINLVAAPATIVEFHNVVLKDTVDSLVGLNEPSIDLINSTPKTIKEITFTFSFKDERGEAVYDIKTGNEYCMLRFSDLEGRTTSTELDELAKGVARCFHHLDYDKASYRQPFYNKTASYARLEKVNIKYADNTTSDRVSLFDKGFFGNGNLYHDGPLQPVTAFLAHLDEDKGKPVDEADEKVYDIVEEMPSFKGGAAAMAKYIDANKKYPVVATGIGVQGRVIVSVIIEKDGSLSNVSVAKSVDPSLDREAMRIVKSMPKWNPGRQNGRAVRVRLNIPIAFRL